MYLNRSKLSAYRTANGFIIGICGITVFFNILFFIFLLTSSSIEKDFATFIVNTFLFFIISFKAGIIIWRLLMIRRLSKCMIYNSLLEEDHDGILSYSSIASMTGKTESAVIKDIMWLVRSRFLINVTVGRTAVRVDLLTDEREFVTVLCPTCGAHIVIRKNGGGRCDHCGTFMRLKEGTDV